MDNCFEKPLPSGLGRVTSEQQLREWLVELNEMYQAERQMFDSLNAFDEWRRLNAAYQQRREEINRQLSWGEFVVEDKGHEGRIVLALKKESK